MSKSHVHFDGRALPAVGERLDELEHTLRYGVATRADALLAASVIAAYRHLVKAETAERTAILDGVREESAQP